MVNYFVTNDREYFMVVERDSNLVIKKTKSNREANNVKNFLNCGGGFDGWTPNFMVKSVKDHHENLFLINTDY